jgi:hypothetical protein
VPPFVFRPGTGSGSAETPPPCRSELLCACYHEGFVFSALGPFDI